MIPNIKILELNKQHYFDHYNAQMKCDYSCWGYYDGIRIFDAPLSKNNLFEKKTNAPVSPIWFGMGESIEKLKGKFSKQNIGIFRDSTKNEELLKSFWQEQNGESPYFSVMFIQLKNSNSFDEMTEKIESISFESNETSNIYRRVLAYFTFDNAEIVGLIKTNSLRELGRTIQEIEKMPEISYAHSIMGVSEPYLTKCNEVKKVLPTWQGVDCNIEEDIAGALIKVVTSGQKETIGKIKSILQTQYEGACENLTYSWMAGHGSIALKIPKTKVKNALRLMFPDGFSTHFNPLYGSEIYNIETELYMESASLDSLNAVEVAVKKISGEKMWCELLIEKYVNKMREALDKKDEGLYSYYRALVQTLNTLMQYEGFSLSENIFFFLYPSFNMFDTLLDFALEQAQDRNKQCDMVTVKESICEFMSAVNAIIYHVIHTDQIFLMVPGYSGTSYSIPIKLCLMYLGIAEDIICLLNEKKYNYTCLLTPETEVRPRSHPIDMGVYSDNRLIQVCSSQRFLYMPRHFMVVLTHEIAHYIGTDMRMRDERCEYIIKTIACYLAEGIFPEGIPEGIDRDIYIEICKKFKESVRDDCVKFLKEKVSISNVSGRNHGKQLKEILANGCQKYLAANENGVGRFFDMLFSVLEKTEEENLLAASEELYKQRVWLEKNRISLLHSGIMHHFIDTILKLYRETFSDIAAMTILDCKIETFAESLDVSEGFKIEGPGNRSDFSNARKMIIEELFGSVNQTTKSNDAMSSESSLTKLEEHWPLHYYEEIYNYVWLKKYLVDYGEKCKKLLQERISNNDLSVCLNEIRTIFKMFSEDTNSCSEIYGNIMKCIHQYTQRVREKYIQRKAELNKKVESK